MLLVPVRTGTTRIGADRRVGLKNSRDCDDRILARRNGDNRAADAARTFRLLRPHVLERGLAPLGPELLPRMPGFARSRMPVYTSPEGVARFRQNDSQPSGHHNNQLIEPGYPSLRPETKSSLQRNGT